MKYRRVDANGDYMFGHGLSDFASETEAVAQAITTKIMLLKNEWWEDLEAGTDLFQNILSQKLTDEGVNAIDIIIKDRVLEVKDVATIREFKSQVNRNAKTYTANLLIETTFGDLEKQVSLSAGLGG